MNAARPCTPGKVPRQQHMGPGVDSLEQSLAQVSGADQLLVDNDADISPEAYSGKVTFSLVT